MQHYFCNGKKGICDNIDCGEECPFYDGTGGSMVESEVAALVKGAENPYWERICKLSERQREKGMKTYGKGLEDNPLSIVERITYLEEELIDALMYMEHIKAYLEDGKDE